MIRLQSNSGTSEESRCYVLMLVQPVQLIADDIQSSVVRLPLSVRNGCHVAEH